ncbi:hypothetical protein ACWDR1_18970 [Streptosporangium sandarakinum]|uniref:hypothetical protein n=1 Tax=Streptosporangium sandarakinum TaxID=1260955 RepID=UPI0033B88A38
MYEWIWRLLPGGPVWKTVTALTLAGLAVAVLWLFVFPWIETRIPFDHVTLVP